MHARLVADLEFTQRHARKTLRVSPVLTTTPGLPICLVNCSTLRLFQPMPLFPQTPSSLASFESRLGLPFRYRLTQVVLERSPLNGCSNSSSVVRSSSSLPVYKSLRLQSVVVIPSPVRESVVQPREVRTSDSRSGGTSPTGIACLRRWRRTAA